MYVQIELQLATSFCAVLMCLGQSRHGSCLFLIRSSSACAGEFVLSFFFGIKYLHYNITYTNDYNYCFENGPHFAGIVKLLLCVAINVKKLSFYNNV